MAKTKSKKGEKLDLEKDDVPVLVEISTGLANQKTKPRKIPEAYLNQSVKDVINYLERTVEKRGDSNEQYVVASVHDQMTGQYIIKANDTNVDSNAKFSEIVKKTTQVENVGDGGQYVPVRALSFIVTKVEKGG